MVQFHHMRPRARHPGQPARLLDKGLRSINELTGHPCHSWEARDLSQSVGPDGDLDTLIREVIQAVTIRKQ
jgi:hypothetical protein